VFAQVQSTVVIKKDGEEYSADSILDVLSANLDCGSHMLLSAEGPTPKPPWMS